jgi:hypothetical protein
VRQARGHVRPAWPELLTALLYELLDAHLDTAELAKDLLDERWRAHLDYLRALQRTGRELMARAHR